MRTRLAVIDSNTLTRYALGRLVAQSGDLELVGECGSAGEAARMVAEARPAVVTVDVALPDGDGLRVARELRDRDRTLGIVVLTAHGADDVLFRAMETGASAFVATTAPVEELLAAIRHAAVAAASFTAAGLATAFARRAAAPAAPALLSEREREVLDLLAEGLSAPAIAARIYVSTSTVKTYTGRLYDKLGATNRAQALMSAIRLGLIRSAVAHADLAPPARTA